jgi:hypothetical protein
MKIRRIRVANLENHPRIAMKTAVVLRGLALGYDAGHALPCDVWDNSGMITEFGGEPGMAGGNPARDIMRT